ncbi:MAG: hypothetical protein R2807_03040 [Chitinophagales bacterium]
MAKPAPKPIAQPEKSKKTIEKPIAKKVEKKKVEQPIAAPIVHKPKAEVKQMETTVARYSDADLAIFKEVIQKKIAKAKDEIDFYVDQIKSASESQTEFASIDDGSSTSERENMNQIVVRMQKLISHLESALVRIENKSYGICRETEN